MENKTDKPYSLQDAKDEVALKYLYVSWNEIPDPPEKWLIQAAELYASKATEELRKENVRLDKEANHWMNQCLIKSAEIERLKESNKVKDEAINGLRKFNNTQDERWREYSKKLQESNKELVEALRNAVAVYKKYANDNPEEDHIFNHCEELIQKSEGDVNKKI